MTERERDRPTPKTNEEHGRVIKDDDRRRVDTSVQPSTVGEGDGDKPPRPRK